MFFRVVGERRFGLDVMASSSANSRIFFFGSSGSAWAGSGCPKRHDIDKTGDAAQKENELSSEAGLSAMAKARWRKARVAGKNAL